VADHRRVDHLVAGRRLLPGRGPRDHAAGLLRVGFASALLLFASILAHEFGHALVARRRGVEIEEIDLWPLGGVARMSGRPQSANDELRFALAGPAVTAVVAAVFGALALVLPSSAPAALRAVVRYQAEVNLLILGFNLVPAFPLDGGRVARALPVETQRRHRPSDGHRRRARTRDRLPPDRRRDPAVAGRLAWGPLVRGDRRIPDRGRER
jgi:hypothetical protein